jgi:hypothetical protein
MPFPIAAAAIGAVARTAAGSAARGAMTGARFGIRGAKSPKAPVTKKPAIGRSLSLSQFGETDSNVNITGPAVHEMLGRTPQ